MQASQTPQQGSVGGGILGFSLWLLRQVREDKKPEILTWKSAETELLYYIWMEPSRFSSTMCMILWIATEWDHDSSLWHWFSNFHAPQITGRRVNTQIVGSPSWSFASGGLDGAWEFSFLTSSRSCLCCYSRDHTWEPFPKERIWHPGFTHTTLLRLGLIY